MSRPFPSRSFHSREPLHRRNGKIRAREVRVIGDAKQQLGVMTLNEALRLAQDKGLDLIEIAPTATPPVCRIVDYGKFLYEEVQLRFRGRQKAHKEIGFEVVNRFVKDVCLYGQADSAPKMLGDRDLNVVLSPLPRAKRAKNPRDRHAPELSTATVPPQEEARLG